MMAAPLPRRHAAVGAAGLAVAACALSVPPLRSLIEQSMVWHMVVQMPLLLLAGWVGAGALAWQPAATSRWNQYGLTSLMAIQFFFAYWMLPVAIDRAVVLPSFDLLKLLSLLVCGALLRRAVVGAPAALQLFFAGYAMSMLLAAGAFLATSERRLCNAYSLESQLRAGYGLMAMGVAVGCVWLWRAGLKAR